MQTQIEQQIKVCQKPKFKRLGLIKTDIAIN
jgi:hypothetical protein